MSEIVIAREGRYGCNAICTQPENPIHRFALRELNRCLKLSLGSRAGGRGSPGIVLDSGTDENDGFRISVSDSLLRIRGNNPRSLLFGVYSFLKRYCGCRWLDPREEIIPGTKSVVVTLEEPWCEESPIRRRNMYPEGHRLPVSLARSLIAWAPRNNISDITVSFSAWEKWRSSLAPELEKRGLRLSLSGHCLPMFVPKTEFESHPEWFARIDGKRTPRGQYCFSSQSFRKELTRRMLEFVEDEPLLAKLSIWAQDNSLLCECARCRKTGFLRSFVDCINGVAKAGRKRFPGVGIEFLAYNAALAWDMLEPVGGLDLSHCSTEIAYWGRDYRYGVGVSRAPADQRAVRCMEGWRKATSNSLHILEYYTGLWMHTHLIAPLPTVIAGDCSAYATMGIDELDTLIVLCAADLHEKARSVARYAPLLYPNLYFYATFAWNPGRKPGDVLDDYCLTLFGSDGRLCMKYLLKLEQVLANISSFNRALFRLRFVDIWHRDVTPEEGGIKFLAREWSPGQRRDAADRRRFSVCGRMIAAMETFERKHGWKLSETNREQGRRAREFEERWKLILRRLQALHCQLEAQQAMSRGKRQEALSLLRKAAGVKGISKTERKQCGRWIRYISGS